jgi:hypothetical protein
MRKEQDKSPAVHALKMKGRRPGGGASDNGESWHPKQSRTPIVRINRQFLRAKINIYGGVNVLSSP